MKVGFTSSRATNPGEPPRFGLLAWKWLWLASAIMAGASIFAWHQPGNLPLADRSESRLGLWEKFSLPIEINPHRRLASTRANLTSVQIMGDGKRGWATGNGIVLRTDDGGRTWRKGAVQLDKQGEHVNGLIFFADGNSGIAISQSGSVFVSGDGGDSWVQGTKLPGDPRFLTSLAFSRNGKFGVLVNDEGDTFTTDDRGTAWQPKSRWDKYTDGLPRVAVGNDGRSIWLASTDKLYHSADGGKTANVRLHVESGSLHDLHISEDGNRIWIISRKNILHSADAGASWRQQYSSPHELLGITFNRDGQHGWAVGAAGYAVRTNDGGQNWQLSPTASPNILNEVMFDQRGLTGIAVGDLGTVLVSNDGGQSWRAATAPRFQQWAMAASADLSHGWIASAAGIHFTHDAGRHWKMSNASSLARGLKSLTFNLDNKHGWGITQNGSIIATSDGGFTWSLQASDTTAPLHAIYFLSDALHGWAYGQNAALATANGGKSWQAVPALASRSFHRLFFANDGQRGWALDASAIWGTRDGGSTWERQVDARDRVLYDLVFDDNGMRGYAVGANSQIFSTSDGGQNWVERVYAGESNLLSVTLSTNGVQAWASGSGGTIIHTSDGGANWRKQDSGLTEGIRSLHFNRDSARGLAIGQDGAIISSADGGTSWAPAEPYLRLPAPWYWLVVLLAAIPVWLSWHLRPVNPARQSVADVGASDAEIRAASDDRLEFSGLARGISRFLRNPATSAPLTLAISGDWGSGKSSLMQLICSDLRRFDHYPIWFNAWHHQKEEHLFAALLGAIHTQAVPPTLSLAGVSFRLRLLWLRSRKHFGIMLLLLAGATALLAINLPLVSRFGLGNLLTSIENLAKIGQPVAILLATLGAAMAALAAAAKPFHANPALLLTTLRDNMSVRKAAAHNDFRDQFAQQFGELTAALPQRLVVVIDDLDRCRPSAVLDVMEAVNYLTSSGQCVVIFGMARERVLASLGLACKDIAAELVMMESSEITADGAPDPAVARRRSYAADYLQKLINIEIAVPSTRDRPLHQLLMAPETAPRRAVLGTFALLWKLWPIAAVGAAIIVGLSLARWPMPSSDDANASPVPTRIQPARTMQNTEVTVPVPPQLATSPQTGTPLRSATLQAGQQESALSVVTWVMLGMVPIIITGSLVLLRLLRKTVNETRDSEQFRAALEIWTPLVAAKRHTPRSIKRFGNRMRYLAMLQQGEQNDETQFDIIRRRLAGIFNRRRAAPSSSVINVLAEQQMIAMGAIHELYGVNWKRHIAPSPASTSFAAQDSPIDVLRQAIHRHQQTFLTEWPPDEAEILVFERLLAGVRLAGDPQVLAPSVLRRSTHEDSSAETA